MHSTDTSRFYSGMTDDGKLILTPEYARACEGYAELWKGFRGRAVDAEGRGRWPPPMRTRAFDEGDDPRDEYYRELEAEYEKLRGKPSAGSWRNLESVSEQHGMGDPRAHAAETATRGGCWNREEELQKSYDEARRTARGLGTSLAILLLACISVLPLRAQPQPGVIYGTAPGIPPIGAHCQWQPWQTGTPNAYLTPNGQVIVCQTATGSNVGVWSFYQSFNAFQGTGSAVNMNGSDVSLLTFTVPPLAAGGCYRIDYGVGAGLSSATIKVKIDGTTISTPFTAGSNTGVNVSIAGVLYCNNAGTQSAQTLTYTFGAAGFVTTFFTPNSGWSYSAGGPSENDSPISTPAAIDWSVPHTLTITANQASGIVVPNYAHLSGGN
jgi:hypothetical protein